jgi:hypothetical protein
MRNSQNLSPSIIIEEGAIRNDHEDSSCQPHLIKNVEKIHWKKQRVRERERDEERVRNFMGREMIACV